MNIPPKSDRQQMRDFRKGSGKMSITVDRFQCADTKLIVNTNKPGKLPLEFDISDLRMKDVGPGVPLIFDATLVNPKPVGDIKGAQMGTYFIAIVGLNIVTGYTGQISLAQGAFMAVGGYTTAFLVTHGVRDLWTIPVAALVAGVFGFLLGIPALRLSGLYLALVTFGLAVAMPDLLAWDKLNSLTSGGQSIQLFGSKHLLGQGFNDVTVFGHTTSFNRAVYYLTWTLALVLFALAWLLLRGAPGRAFRAVRDSEVAAASSGVNIAAYKTVAFAIGAAYAGVAGSLLVIAVAFADPQSFPAKLSLTILVGAVIAGLGSMWGVLLGAAFVQFLPVASVHISKAQGVPDAIYGAALILIVLLLPTGIAGALKRAASPLTTRLYTRS
jgi:branched-chain amino acid transport system permease protein